MNMLTVCVEAGFCQIRSHITIIWRCILAWEHSIAMKFAVIVARGLFYDIISKTDCIYFDV